MTSVQLGAKTMPALEYELKFFPADDRSRPPVLTLVHLDILAVDLVDFVGFVAPTV